MVLVGLVGGLSGPLPKPLVSWAPEWVRLGSSGWVRIQRDPRVDEGVLLEVYSNGRRVKSKQFFADCFLDDIQPTVCRVGGDWFLYFDSHPGAGDTWFTYLLRIRRSDLRFEGLRQFEHG